MDLKAFYQKMREVAAEIAEAYVVVTSLETADGGRAGVASEVAKAVAALMIVQGKARLATGEEAKTFRERIAEAKNMADQLAAAGKVQLTVLSDADLRALKGGTKKG
jgi:hypothetical protein